MDKRKIRREALAFLRRGGDLKSEATFIDGVNFALDKVEEHIENFGMKKEPYFGWCDVEGCEEEAAGGGVCWRETGFWRTCSKHFDDYRKGKPQPTMKPKAIAREKSRDSKTGYLPSVIKSLHDNKEVE